MDTIEYNLEEGRRVKLKTEEGLSALMGNSSNIDMITTEVRFKINPFRVLSCKYISPIDGVGWLCVG